MRIYFDMDGTIANLYGMPNWLDDLRAYNPRPYKNARPLINMNTFARLLNRLTALGHSIGIVSWLSKTSTVEYDIAVTKAKYSWLKRHLRSVHFEEIHIVPYGTPKEEVVFDCDGILFDDEEKNRKNWKGIAYNEKNIIEILKEILNGN